MKYFDVGNSKNLIDLFGQLLCKVNMRVATAAAKTNFNNYNDM